MPEISRFYGITIRMWYDDHPPPHIHVEYGEYRAKLYLTGEVEGHMPKRALNLIWVWMEEHEDELEQNWERARNQVPLHSIEPLR